METNADLIKLVLVEFLTKIKEQPQFSPEEFKIIETLAQQGKLADLTAIQTALQANPAKIK